MSLPQGKQGAYISLFLLRLYPYSVLSLKTATLTFWYITCETLTM